MSISDIVAAMAPGSWYELPDTRMRDVFPAKDGHPAWGVEGPGSIVADWCGAAFDTDRNVFIITGGGHTNYGGNEIYEFPLDALRWSRVTNPSPMVPDAAGDPYYVTTDGSRVSSHTYDGLAYIPPLKSLFLWGGSQYRSGNPSDQCAYLVDLRTHRWARKAKAPSGVIEVASAWDSKRNRMLCVYKTGLYAHYPVADAWSTVASGWWMQSNATAAYSPDHDIFLLLSGESHVPIGYIALSKGDALAKAPIAGADCPTWRVGIAYRPEDKLFYIWAGAGSVWTLDPSTWECVEHKPTGATPAVPKSFTGVYSKWQYSPKYGVFIGYTDSSGNVWLYKPGASDGIPANGDAGVDGAGDNSGSGTGAPESGSGGGSTPPTDPPVNSGPGIISVVRVGPGQVYKTPSSAAGAVKDGDTVKIDPGTYTDGCAWPCSVNIESAGDEAPVIGGTVVLNKGVWVVQGAQTQLTNIHLTKGLGGTSNAAGIRHEGKSLTLRNCEIDDCHNGILTTHDPESSLEVYDTHFHGMNTRGDLAHNIYAGKIARLIVDGCLFEDGQSGHFIKSLSAHTTIAYTRIIQHADLDAALIDLWGCQEFEVVGCAMLRTGRYGALAFIQVTPRITEGKTIACPPERLKKGLVAYNTAFFNNDLHDDPRWSNLVHYNWPMPNLTVANNFVVHTNEVVWDDKNYGFAANGGKQVGNQWTKTWDLGFFTDPGNGDLSPAREPQAAAAGDFVPDRQIALPVGTVPRADAGCVGAFAYKAVVSPPVDPPADPPVESKTATLQPGEYTLAPGKYVFKVG